MQWGYRDYGNRVGVWRLAEAFAEYPIRITASTNLAIFEHCPEIAALVRERGWEVMSHGLYNTRYLGRSTEAEERAAFALEAEICETPHRHAAGRAARPLRDQFAFDDGPDRRGWHALSCGLGA